MSSLLFFLKSTDPCTNIAYLKTILFIRRMISVIFIIVPTFMIVMLAIDLFRGIISFKNDDTSKVIRLLVKRLIYCVVMFTVPTIINLVATIVDNMYDDFCYNVTAEMIEEQIVINKNSCFGEFAVWNENSLTCDIKMDIREVTEVNKKYISVLSKDSSSSSSSQSGDVSSNYGGYNKDYPLAVNIELGMLKYYNDSMKKDKKKWYYSNTNMKFDSLYNLKSNTGSGTTKKPGANCATSINWVLKDLGLMPASGKIYQGDNGGIQNYSKYKKDIETAMTYRDFAGSGKNVKQLVSEGKIKPGDMIFAAKHGDKHHAWIYMYGKTSFAAGRESDGHGSGYNYIHTNWIKKSSADWSSYKVGAVLRFKKDYTPPKYRNASGKLVKLSKSIS